MLPSTPFVTPLRVLILGGTSEANALARTLAGRTDIAATLSLAGRTSDPIDQPLPVRSNGFGGVGGLATYLRSEGIDVLVDATHPFAARMSRHAREAASLAACPHLRVSRKPWSVGLGDRWTDVATMDDVPAALGPEPKRVFLTIGRLQLAVFAKAPQHDYLVRTIEPVPNGHGLPRATFIQDRGPFDINAELRLMNDHRIEVLVTKNSGGDAVAPKLEVARRLSLPVILVRRPDDRAALSVAEAIAIIEAHATSARRGV